MKIAVAGTNGLAQFIAYYLTQVTSHSFVFLTRTVCVYLAYVCHTLTAQANPGLSDRGWQVLVVDYQNPASLAYTLKGVDLVISTVSGKAQLALVEASAAAKVRHFIPSAFSGPEQSSPQNLGQQEWQNLSLVLQHHEARSSMRYTLFTCGVFYERFGPGGLNALQISTLNSRHSAVGEEGNMLVDLRLGKAIIPVVAGMEELAICLTSAQDAARYVVATIEAYEDMHAWPHEFKFCTERQTMSELVAICARVRGMYSPFQCACSHPVHHFPPSAS